MIEEDDYPECNGEILVEKMKDYVENILLLGQRLSRKGERLNITANSRNILMSFESEKGKIRRAILLPRYYLPEVNDCGKLITDYIGETIRV